MNTIDSPVGPVSPVTGKVGGVAARRRLAAWIGSALLVAGTQGAQAAAPFLAALPELKDLAELELEQLARITVTSVTLRQQRLSDAPAAIFVITAEDIRRSGATSIPEALRLAPILHVARADANQYAISARGFNNVLANKMLVMIDGRTVYSPLFSGVFWEAQQVMLEDVDRIEVISGPGAALWGANAVNGLINVITRPAGETQGLLATAAGGNRDQAGALRWGGAFAQTARYRVYATTGKRENTSLTTGAPVDDGAQYAQGGFRIDGGTSARKWTVQGDTYRNDIQQAAGGSRDLAGANVVARWTATLDDGAYLSVQSYYDHVERDQPQAVRERLDTFDAEVHHGFSVAQRHRVLWGGGYRALRDQVRNLSPTFALLPPTEHLHRAHVFAQDEIALASSLALTLGIKLEHNNYTGWETLPDARLAWHVSPDHMVWGSLSRAVRSPSRVDRDFFVPANPPYFYAGGPDAVSEVAQVAEVGYRAQPTSALSYSISVFHHAFDRLRTTEPAAGGALNENRAEGRLRGVNGWGSYRMNTAWRLTGGFMWMRERLSLEPGSMALGGTTGLGNDPTHWWQFGSSFNLTPRHELDLSIRRVGALANGPVPAYTEVDARFGWKVTPTIDFSLTLRDVLDGGHVEWGAPANRAEIERSVFARLTWRM